MARATDALAPWPAKLKRARVLLVGDLVLDEYVYGLSDRISREAPVVVVRETRRERVLGGAANVAAGLRAYGANCTVVGVVGDDEAGAELVGRLRDRGASVSGVVRVPGHPTATKTRILAGGLSTTPQQVLRLDRGANGHEVPPDAVARLRAAVAKALPRADVVVVSDYGLGVLARPLVRDLCRAAGDRPLLVDSRYDLPRYAGATLLKPNAPELEAASGRRVTDATSAARAARHLARHLGVEAVLVTRGHAGLTFQPRTGRALHLPVFGPPEAVDVTGAGDTVLATLAAAAAAGADWQVAARLANVAGGLVVQKPGTATLDPEELAVALAGGKEVP